MGLQYSNYGVQEEKVQFCAQFS